MHERNKNGPTCLQRVSIEKKKSTLLLSLLTIGGKKLMGEANRRNCQNNRHKGCDGNHWHYMEKCQERQHSYRTGYVSCESGGGLPCAWWERKKGSMNRLCISAMSLRATQSLRRGTRETAIAWSSPGSKNEQTRVGWIQFLVRKGNAKGAPWRKGGQLFLYRHIPNCPFAFLVREGREAWAVFMFFLTL